MIRGQKKHKLPVDTTEVEEKLKALIRKGKACYAYDGKTNRIKIVYNDEAVENPVIEKAVDETRSILNELYANHRRIVELRDYIRSSFFDTKIAEELTVELNNLVANQKHTDALLPSLDFWDITGCIKREVV